LNVKDVQAILSTGGEDRLYQMLATQTELMEKYHEIEGKLRLTQDCPVDLNDSRGQLLLKDFAWRATEEVAEALSAMRDHQDPDSLLHAQEEIADALHFLLEMFLLSVSGDSNELSYFDPPEGYVYKGDRLTQLYKQAVYQSGPVPMHFVDIETETLEFIRQLGMVCHTLKNKPWKQTQMLTDKGEYHRRMHGVLVQFCRMAHTFQMDDEALFQMYHRKSEVNKFRQRSAY